MVKLCRSPRCAISTHVIVQVGVKWVHVGDTVQTGVLTQYNQCSQ